MTDISEQEYESAVSVIRQYKSQIDKERSNSFLKRLEEFNKTYWFLKGRTQKIFLSCIATDYGYAVTKFIENTNGIIEIKCDGKNKEDLEYYLSEMGEYAPDEWELQEGKKNFIFTEIPESQFVYDVTAILLKIKISDWLKLNILPNKTFVELKK